MSKPVKVVKEFRDCEEDARRYAQLLAISLNEMGHTAEVVKGQGWDGWRVISEDEEAVKMVDFHIN